MARLGAAGWGAAWLGVGDAGLFGNERPHCPHSSDQVILADTWKRTSLVFLVSSQCRPHVCGDDPWPVTLYANQWKPSPRMRG